MPAPAQSRRVTVGLAILIVAVLVAGIVIAVVRPDSSTSASATSTPRDDSATSAGVVSRDYYLAVEHDQVRTAYSLLCSRQQGSFTQYADELATDIRTGTGVASFSLAGSAQVRGQAAGVPARIGLADGEQTPIIVLLTDTDGQGWRICSSNLGGVLPGPGTGSSPSPTPSGSTV